MTLVERLEDARRREKAQTLFYRSLAMAAEDAGDAARSETLNELHADEQHHLSRLTARLLELGAHPADLRTVETGPVPALEDWTGVAHQREAAEVAFYESLLDGDGLDDDTRRLLETILDAERHHLEHLGGKWMSA